jgi:hypothetical protein
MAFEACKGLVDKPDHQLSANDRKLLEALEAAAAALRAALSASAPEVN